MEKIAPILMTAILLVGGAVGNGYFLLTAGANLTFLDPCCRRARWENRTRRVRVDVSEGLIAASLTATFRCRGTMKGFGKNERGI